MDINDQLKVSQRLLKLLFKFQQRLAFLRRGLFLGLELCLQVLHHEDLAKDLVYFDLLRG